MNTTLDMKHVDETSFREVAEKSLAESKLRLEWWNKLCAFIAENYPQGVKIGMRVQKKLDEAFGAYKVRIFASVVCWEIEIDGIGSNFQVCYIPQSYPIDNAGMLLLEEFQKQNRDMADYEAYITQKEQALERLSELVTRYNETMSDLEAYNSTVPSVYPFTRLKIHIEDKKNYFI